MSDDITGLCRDHSFETAVAVCRRCGLEFCELCLVYPFGNSRPLCKECAMAEGGVRSHVARAPMNRRDLRKKLKAFKARQQRTAANANGDGGGPRDIPAEDPVATDHLTALHDDLDRVPVTHAVRPDAEEAASAFDAPPPAPPSPAAEPAEGVAPPIDWNQPFG